jgi:hypothetical protein
MTYEKTDRVQAICDAEGIAEDEFQQMVNSSALVRAHEFNRRFHGWLFDVRGKLCQNMRRQAPLNIGNPKQNNGFVEEEHLECDGLGCRACGWSGRVVRWF